MIAQLENTSLLKEVCLRTHPIKDSHCRAVEAALYCMQRLSTPSQKSFCEHTNRYKINDDPSERIVTLGKEQNWSPGQTVHEIELIAEMIQKLKNEQQ
jgi:hypothetical protein